MSKNKRYRWQSAERNNQTYFDYLHRLKNLAINSFKWENVPDTINIAVSYTHLDVYKRQDKFFNWIVGINPFFISN